MIEIPVNLPEYFLEPVSIEISVIYPPCIDITAYILLSISRYVEICPFTKYLHASGLIVYVCVPVVVLIETFFVPETSDNEEIIPDMEVNYILVKDRDIINELIPEKTFTVIDLQAVQVTN